MSTKLHLKRVCKGLYMDHENGFVVDHELAWEKSVGRKWVAEWKESYMGLFAPSERRQKFDTFAEARAFLAGLLK